VTALPLLAFQAAAPSGFERTVAVLADVATIVIALAIIVVGAVLIYGALKARSAIRRAKTDLHPAIRSLTAAAGNVEGASVALRKNVEAVGATVQDATEKARRAADAAEQRLGELNALLGVVQHEAEEAFVKTAAAVRGVQAGTGALRRGGESPELRVAPPAGGALPD
jgi:hypothetical protein